jgi:quercetin 2,3-dioxygenase
MFTVEVPRGAGVPAHVHESTSEALYVLEGALRVWLDDGEHVLSQGDYASIPAGTVHRWEGDAFFSKAIAMSTPGGLEQLVSRLGEPTDLHMFGGDGAPVSADALSAAADGVDVTLA